MQEQNLNFIPVVELSEPELRVQAEQLHDLVSKESVQDNLKVRNLLGVLARHTISPEHSAEQLLSLKAADTERKVSAFLITQSQDDSAQTDLVGMATIQEGLPLRRLSTSLPAAFARRLPLLHQVVETPAANVAAWTYLERDEDPDFQATSVDQSLDIQQSYTFLRSQAPKSWTLLTRPESETAASKTLNFSAQSWGLYAAGYTPAGVPGALLTARWDEGESRLAPPPKSWFFVSYEPSA